MTQWRKINRTWCIWPSRPKELIEMIGGSYLGISPNISYKRLLEGLSKKNIAIHAWNYIPGFDHQAQANEAWKEFRECRFKLESRIGIKSYRPVRIGHSLGCKLHLISPDRGRIRKLFIGLSFNNFKADSSVPMLGKFKRKLNIESEFSPSPIETMNLISKNYIQPRNILIKFKDDKIDQTKQLLEHLHARKKDNSIIIELEGNHLTPASSGFKDFISKRSLKNNYEVDKISKLIDTIYRYTTE